MAAPIYNQRSSNSSGSSLPTMRTMSIITQYSDAYNPGALPKGPLRVPKRQSRRDPALSVYSQQSPYVSPEPSVAAEKDSSTGKEIEAEKGLSAEKEQVSPPRAGTGSGDSARSVSSECSIRDDDKGLFAHRKRAGRFLVAVAIVAIVIVALAIGLAVGLRKRGGTTGSDPFGLGVEFPAGSYAVRASVKTTEAGCTSQPSTWRCDSSGNGASVTAHWDIRSRGHGVFTISSPNDSELNPAFSDVSLSVVDANRLTERLVFTIPMNKTVIPSGGASPTSRAAQCLYQNVEMEATLYTRQRGGRTMSAPSQLGQGVDWPGDVEINQHMPSTIGQPTCRDSGGVQIADVQASQGNCACVYSNN
ncbi:hypothetical protein L249_4583 [Ophiocordyceps polyrhachis-furcata BCC 54312]|uniref:Tat pathway signal sequence n=1 Tax=Ophiocordyceps polyrhachis-furcata BCC 54312 TaxID=1330021 RepID=A0A367LC43_9HYPO|nr:hypothetical protein L249_4583 [Ophiocordyceps polyrhachis-furcata BCC 54312]